MFITVVSYCKNEPFFISLRKSKLELPTQAQIFQIIFTLLSQALYQNFVVYIKKSNSKANNKVIWTDTDFISSVR